MLSSATPTGVCGSASSSRGAREHGVDDLLDGGKAAERGVEIAREGTQVSSARVLRRLRPTGDIPRDRRALLAGANRTLSRHS